MIRVTLRLLAATVVAIAPCLHAQPAPEPGAGPRTADAAEVIASEGQTMLVRGSSFQSPVRRDAAIRTGDRIRTGADGTVQLRFTDGALMSVQPGSDFRVEAYAYDAASQRGFFELLQGSVRAVSGRIGKRDRDDWRLRTPTATVGIRGTEFTVTETPCPKGGCTRTGDGGFSVAVIAGRVSVANEAGSVEVPAGASLRLTDARTVPTLALVAAGRPAAPPALRPAGVSAGQIAGPAAEPATGPPAWIAPGTGSAPAAPGSFSRR
ncbi:MAG: hypothetical protein RJA99_2633 [Pseudomonadota bacterium]